MKKIREWIKTHFDLFDIDDLTIGGHCGICGSWMPDEIFIKGWTWGLCNTCGVKK